MAKKKKNKINYVNASMKIFFSVGFLTIILASSWWSGLKEDGTIKLKFSDK